MHSRRTIATLAASLLLVAAACGSDNDDATPTTSADAASTVATTSAVPSSVESTIPATTAAATSAPTTAAPTTELAAPSVTPEELAADGPFEVGITTRSLASGELVEIWYPADDAATGASDSYAMRNFVPDVVADLAPPDVDDTFTIAASRDGAPAEGSFPIVLFSHGSAAFRTQSSELARHLASWGIAVAATDHPSRYLANALVDATDGQSNSVDDVRAMREYLETLPADDPLAGTLDTSLVAVSGHSAGGFTAAELATEPGIAGYVSYASGLAEGTVPEIPSLFMAGELDGIVEPDRTEESFERAVPPSWLWVVDGAGHLAFSDLCAIGGGEGNLIDLAEAAGVADFVNEQVRRLATDGCDPPNRSVQDVWPAINQASTGFYRFVFGIDEEPVGLDASAVTSGVMVTSKP